MTYQALADSVNALVSANTALTSTVQATQAASNQAIETAQQLQNEFRNLYYGPRSTDPTVRPNGSAIQVGDEYHNTTTNKRRVYGNSGWEDFIGASTADLANTNSSTKGAGMVYWLQSGIGAVARTLLNKARDTIHICDFGAAADGVTDDTTAVQKAETEAAARGGGVVNIGKAKISANAIPPGNVTREYTGAPVNRVDQGGASGLYSLRSSYSFIDGPHPTYQMAGRYFRTLAKGSGSIGQQYCDQAVSIHIQKQHWSETTGTPQTGEINGLTITYRQGGPRMGSGDPNQGQSSGAAILANIQATQGSGASQFFEIANTVVDVPSLAINRNIGVQCAMINTRDNDYYGMVFISNQGIQDAAIKCHGVGSSRWSRIIENFIGTLNNYNIEDTGRHRWMAADGTIISMDFDDVLGELSFKNNANIEVFRIGQTKAIAAPIAPNVQTVTAYSIGTADHSIPLVLANSSPITATLLNSAKLGTRVRVLQRDSGQITFVPESGAQLRNRQGHTKTAGQYAWVTLEVMANSNGSSAIWYLSDDTAA